MPFMWSQRYNSYNAENNLIYCVKCDYTEARPTEIKNKNQSINVINIQDYKKPKS